MPSPFPGMNPYLEQEDVWHGFHQRFIARAADSLVPQVRPDFVVDIEANVYLHELPADERRQLFGGPDVHVARAAPAAAAGTGPSRPAVTAGAVSAAVPLLAVDEVRDSYIEIRDRKNREVVTVIELLSPSNKRPGDDRGQYVAKRIRALRSRAHFVEIDLLRGWPRMSVDGLPACDYYAMVSRFEDRPRVDVWAVALRQRLPSIPIPLAGGREDAVLDLQAVLDQTYDAAGYEDHIYAAARVTPPLSAADQAWAEGLLPPR